MTDEPKPPKKTAKTPLQKYLSKPLPPFRRGSADCCAFVAGWVNHRLGEEVIKLLPITFGEAKRRIEQDGIEIIGAKYLDVLNWEKVEPTNPQDGDIAVFECEQALGGKAIGIVSAGTVVTRFEDDSLFIATPETITALWRSQ